jgi:hypothetical protein
MPSVNDHMHATVLDPSMFLSFDGKPNYGRETGLEAAVL